MPRFIEHIDKIARIKNRTVLYASFEPEQTHGIIMKAPNHFYDDYKNDTNRKELIEWLDENRIDWQECGHFASETGWQAYGGNIYIDVPWDESDDKFVIVQQRLENADGTPRDPRVKFWAVDLAEAQKNAHHDEPGFWEKWAENF